LTGKILVAPFILALFVLNTDWALIALCALYVTPFLVIWGGLKLLAYIRERLTVRAYNKRERKRETKREEFSPVQAKRAKPVEEQIADYYEGY